MQRENILSGYNCEVHIVHSFKLYVPVQRYKCVRVWYCYTASNIRPSEIVLSITMTSMASQTTSLTIIYPTVYSGSDQRKHQSSAALAFVRGMVNSPHKWPVTRKMFPFDDVIMPFDKLGRSWYRGGSWNWSTERSDWYGGIKSFQFRDVKS